MTFRNDAIFELSPLAIVVIDVTSGLTLDANPRALELFGVARDQLIGRDTRSLGLTSHTSREWVTTELKAGRVVRDAEASIVSATGHRRLVQYTCVLVELDGGPALLSMMHDVTERRRAERRLDVQLNIAAILSTSTTIEDAAPLILAELCTTQRWSAATLFLVDAHGGPERIVARHGVLPPNLHGSMKFPILAGERVLGHVELGGGLLNETIDAQLQAVAAGIGQQIGLFVTRTRAARETERSEMRLTAVMESMTEGLIVATTDGQILHWNPAALELHGATSSEDWERSLTSFASIMELSQLDGTIVPFAQWPMARIIAGEKLRNLELRLRRLDIPWSRIFRYGGTLVELADGSQIVVLSMADMTERVQVTEELRRVNDSLEQRVDERTASLSAANAELEAFTYSVSHDLRAPLRAIRGFADILEQDYLAGLPEQARTYLHTIVQRGGRMAELLESLMMLSKVVRRPMSRKHVDMTALAREAVAELATPETAGLVTVEELPPASADASLVLQVFVNLVGNAIKFARDRATARVTIGALAGTPPVYFVRDNGPGFSNEDAQRLFVPFQRLHEGQEFEGTGVGLALVQRIVVRHGGRVWAEGAVDVGATFYFTLPVAAPGGIVAALPTTG